MSLLVVKGLAKSFETVRAVDSVSFEVRPGQIYGLLGPNGAGKTTTISMISGLLDPDAGEIVVAGTPFAADPQKAKRIMGVVPQEIAVYEELSGRENLEFWGRIAGLSRSEARSRADELIIALSLADRAKDAVKNYSGGMKRRINIGCALLHRPQLILLDEPTVGIDPQARLKILEFIRAQRAAGAAILYTTHYLEEAETLCDRIGIIDRGRVLAEGTLAELQERIGGDRVFVLEADFKSASPDDWDGFAKRFRVIQKTERQLSVAAIGARDPSDCLKELLGLPIRVENVTLKRPSLNDVFLQLTGPRFARMKLLQVLLAKDLRRAWRNPVRWLVNLAIPICITALIGLVFGGRASREVGRIHFAVVDEDRSVLGELLRTGLAYGPAADNLDARFLDRETALRELDHGDLSGVVIVPTNFTRSYFSGHKTPTLELIKNPAQSTEPAILEQLASAFVTAMNAEAPAAPADGQPPKDPSFGNWIAQAGEWVKGIQWTLSLPIVGYQKEGGGFADSVEAKKTGATTSHADSSAGKRKSGPAKSQGTSPLAPIFAWALPGMAAMFLLFLAGHAVSDLHRELAFRTFERYRTFREGMATFVAGKLLFAIVFLLLCSAILIGGGGLVFGINWQQPLALMSLVFAYACCAAGLMAVLGATVPNERRALSLNSVVGTVVGAASGCMFPLNQFPHFIRDHISPLLPTYWFVQTARELQDGAAPAWGHVTIKLLIVSAGLAIWAAYVLQRRFKNGVRD